MPTPLPTKVTAPRAKGFGARINDFYVRLAPDNESELRYYTRDSLAERRDDRGSFYENVLDLGYAWNRTDWSGGEGLDWDPPDRTVLQGEINLVGIRVWNSRSVDVSAPGAGEPVTLDITRKYQPWLGQVVTQLGDMAASTQHLFLVDGSVVRWYDSWTNIFEVDSFDLGTLVFHLAVAPNGSAMATGADGKVYYRLFSSNTFVEVFDPLGVGRPQAAGVWFVKGRFIVGLSNTNVAELLEVTPAADGLSATEVVIDTAVGRFLSIVDSGPALVAACDDGTVRTYTPFLDSNDPSLIGQLIPRGRLDMPSSEIPILLGNMQGILVIMALGSVFTPTGGHALRIYTSEVLDARFDYSVGNVQLIRTWDNATNFADPNAEMVTTRDELFFVVSEIDPTIQLGNNVEYLWRFDAVTAGLSRHSYTFPGNSHSKSSKAWVRFQDQLGGQTYFDDVFHEDVVFEDGKGNLFPEVASYLITPNITFGLNTDLNWLSTIVEARQLDGQGAEIVISRTTDPEAIKDVNDPSWAVVRRLTSNEDSGIELPMTDITSRTLAIKIELIPSNDGLSTPQLTRFAVRGLPKHRDWIVELPVNVSDNINVTHRMPLRIPHWGDRVHNALLDLQGKNVELEVFNPPMLFRGIVSNIMERTRWISPRGASGSRCVVEFRGILLDQETDAGDWLTGIGVTGIAITGIPQSGVL